jgi:hypothetical protein
VFFFFLMKIIISKILCGWKTGTGTSAAREQNCFLGCERRKFCFSPLKIVWDYLEVMLLCRSNFYNV